MAKAAVTIKQTVETTLKPQVVVKLRNLLRGYDDIVNRHKTAATQMAATRNGVFDVVLEDMDTDGFELDGYKIAMVTDGETAKLDQEKLKKLLMAKTGMSLKVIEDWFDRCTKRTPTKPHVRISCPGDKS